MIPKLSNNRIGLLLIILALAITPAFGQRRRSNTTGSGELGRSAVFNPPQVVWGRMQEECQGPNSVECVASIMKQAGATPQAIAFARMINGDGYMDSFREMGKVDIATAFYPFRANTNGATFLVNGSPSLISLEELDRWGKVDIRTDPLYAGIARRFPDVMLWGGDPGYVSIQRLAGGGQRLIFAYALLNGCHACDVAGYAQVGFDFDGSGRFLVAKLLRLTRPTKTHHQHPVKTSRTKSRSSPPNGARTNLTSLPLVASLEGGLLNFSSDGRYVATQTDRDGNHYTSKIWNPGKSQPLLTMEGRFNGFSPDNRFLMISHYGSDYTQVFDLYEVPGGQRLNSWRGWQSAGFSPDSKFIIADVGYKDGKPITEFWSIERGQRTRVLVNKTPAFSHDGKLMIFVDDAETTTSVVAAETNRSIRQLQGKFLWFSQDDRLIATKEKAVLTIWQTATGERLSEIECWGEAYLSPNGELVATEVFDYRRSKHEPITKVSEVRSGKLVASIDGRLTSPYYPFLNNGALIVTDITNSFKSVTRVWQAASGQLKMQLEGGFRGFSSDGQLLLTEIWWRGSEHTTKLWKVENATLFANVEGYPMGFTPDSQFLFTGSKAIRVWRLRG